MALSPGGFSASGLLPSKIGGSNNRVLGLGGAQNAFGHFERQRKRKRASRKRREEEFFRQAREAVDVNSQLGSRIAGSQRAAFGGGGFEASGTSSALESDTLFRTVLENERILSGAAFTGRQSRIDDRIARSDQRGSLGIQGVQGLLSLLLL